MKNDNKQTKKKHRLKEIQNCEISQLKNNIKIIQNRSTKMLSNNMKCSINNRIFLILGIILCFLTKTITNQCWNGNKIILNNDDCNNKQSLIDDFSASVRVGKIFPQSKGKQKREIFFSSQKKSIIFFVCFFLEYSNEDSNEEFDWDNVKDTAVPDSTATPATTQDPVTGSETTTEKVPQCLDQECIQAAGYISLSMDTKQTKPCDNFYQYVCGKWIQDHPFPRHLKSWSHFQRVYFTIREDLISKNDHSL